MVGIYKQKKKKTFSPRHFSPQKSYTLKITSSIQYRNIFFFFHIYITYYIYRSIARIIVVFAVTGVSAHNKNYYTPCPTEKKKNVVRLNKTILDKMYCTLRKMNELRTIHLGPRRRVHNSFDKF